MKNQLKTLGQVTTYLTADTVNAEAFPAWTPSDEMLLDQLSMTGTLGQSFYQSVQSIMTDAVRLLERADAQVLAKAIVRGRNEGFIRTFPILGLVYLSKKDALLFQSVFNQVILTGNDLEDFIGFVRQVRGFGRSVKRALVNWIREKTTPYYAQKYRKQIADAIRLSRFKGEDSIYAYVLQAYKGVKGNSTEKVEIAYQQYPELAAQRDFITAITEKDLLSAHQILQENALDVNALTAYYGSFDRALWQAVAERSPVMRFLKYLAKFLREGVVTEELLQRKINVPALRKAKVFPFRLYIAYQALVAEMQRLQVEQNVSSPPLGAKVLEEALRQTGLDTSSNLNQPMPSVDVIFVLKHLRKVLNEYAEQYDWHNFNDAKWVLAPDISASMGWRIKDNPNLSYAMISAMFVGFFIKGLENITVLPWDTIVHPYKVNRKASLIRTITDFAQRIGGGTYMEAAVEHMLKTDIQTDYAIFFTDTEEYGRGWLNSWKAYHARYPKAVAFLLRADCYQTSPISEEDAKKLNVYQIFGWNDSVIEYMRFVVNSRKSTQTKVFRQNDEK